MERIAEMLSAFVNDCSCSRKYDGVCDEPQGTGLCPAYSDAGDC